MELEQIRERVRAAMATASYHNDKYGRVRPDGSLECGPFLLGNKSGCTPDEYRAAGWFPVNKIYRPECPDGRRLVATGKWREEAGEIRRIFVEQEIVAGPIVIEKARVASLVDAMGLTGAFFAWINSKAAYATAWFDGDPEIEYDPADNASDLASLIAALGIPAERVPGLIEQVTASTQQAPEQAQGTTSRRNDPEPTEEELREAFGEDYDDAVRS